LTELVREFLQRHVLAVVRVVAVAHRIPCDDDCPRQGLRRTRLLCSSALTVLLLFGCRRDPLVPAGFQGLVEYDERVLSFEVPGRVERVDVRRGDRVTAGQPVAMLDDTIESLTTDARRQDANAARADLDLLEAGSCREDVASLAAVGTPAITLADTSHPYVDVFVPQGRLDAIRPGASAEVRVDATGVPFAANVEYVSPETEFTPKFLFSNQERPHLVVRVRVRVADPDGRLHTGVPAFARIKP
jgi:multidrug resistance efflux pump